MSQRFLNSINTNFKPDPLQFTVSCLNAWKSAILHNTWKITQGQNGDNIIHTWIIFFLGGADWHQLIHTGKLYFCPLPKQNKVNEQSFRPKTPLLKVIKKIQLVLNVNLMYWLLSSGPKVTRSDAACLSFKSKARSSFLVPKSRKQRSNLQC